MSDIYGRAAVESARERRQAEAQLAQRAAAALQRLQAAGPRVMLSNSRAATLVPQLSRLLGLAPVRLLAARIARPFLFGTAEVTLRV